MSLRDLKLKREYRTYIDNLAEDFYIPTLKESIRYDRAVGFFSSSVFSKIGYGTDMLIANGGKIRLIASPNLSEDDIDAIRTGYARRDEIIAKALLRELVQPIDKYQKDHLNYIANLIAEGYLDIKIAVMEDENGIGIYHEKMGIIEDIEGNKIVFSGSANETANAIIENYETIDVYQSWISGSDKDRINDKIRAFEAIWNGEEPGIVTRKFKEVTDEFVIRYRQHKIDIKSERFSNREREFFRLPKDVTLYEYQNKAIEAWENNNFFGLLDMATGTGKTYTALGALAYLSDKLNDKLAVIIVVPYQHLVEQWVEDVKAFGVEPIVAYGFTGNKWRQEFADVLKKYNFQVKKNFCIVTTTATFALDDFQKLVQKFKRNFCIVADEVHNLGAKKIRQLLPTKARYRMGLSATLERFMDLDGTNDIKRYFGRVVFSFSLKEAIEQGFLTKYYYYPVINYLDEDEYEEYKELTGKIIRAGFSDDDDLSDNEYLQVLLVKRARIIAACKSKINNLLKVIEPFSKEGNILVYCGATKYEADDFSDEEDIRQIELVSRLLHDKLGMRVQRFTAKENSKERSEIKQMFITGFQIQVITAIKCLDEGVNIPGIKRAFILASSTNPREYIQRRGRILRKYEGKKYAYLYDFFVLPRELSMAKYLDISDRRLDLSLIRKEKSRMMEFASLSMNPDYSLKLIGDIYRAYGLMQ